MPVDAPIPVPVTFHQADTVPVDRMAARRLLHGLDPASRGQGRARRLYGDICGAVRPDASGGETRTLRLHPQDFFRSDPARGPFMLKHMALAGPSRLLGLNIRGGGVVAVDLDDSGGQAEPLDAGSFRAMTPWGGGLALLGEDGLSLRFTDRDMRLGERVAIRGLERPASFLAGGADQLAVLGEDGPAFLNPTGEVIRLCGNGLPFIPSLPCLLGGEAVLLERYPAKADYGEISLAGPTGRFRPLAGGFHRPVGAKPFPGGLLVCDWSGLHLLFIKDGAVTGRGFLDWRPLKEALGLGSGLGMEAFVADGLLYVLFKTAVPTIPQSQAMCLARFRPNPDIFSREPAA
ncbi:hypothetical protein [Desulfohalovibrio reitneri]|uniref:hypothetical protein n=1 Tax=Desulfohalovibrio reitneri TaxID=1307759 RepID=UPI0004A73E92|nr:hypothetical protein [Desulfohalovibrio reitneri]